MSAENQEGDGCMPGICSESLSRLLQIRIRMRSRGGAPACSRDDANTMKLSYCPGRATSRGLFMTLFEIVTQLQGGDHCLAVGH